MRFKVFYIVGFSLNCDRKCLKLTETDEQKEAKQKARGHADMDAGYDTK